MFAYTVRRFLQFIPPIIAITLIVFLLLIVLPGNSALMAGGKQRLSPEAESRLMKKWGLDQPLHVRYFTYIKGVAVGDLGVSFFSREDVGSMLAPRIWPTLKLALSALLIACCLGIPLGFYSALRQGSLIDSLTMIGAVSGVSMPQFRIRFHHRRNCGGGDALFQAWYRFVIGDIHFLSGHPRGSGVHSYYHHWFSFR